MADNVCRPITLYNDFLPPDTEPHSDWDYLAFGYFDGINIGENNLLPDGKCSMEQLWDYDMQQTERLQGTYSQQTIYAFRAGNDADFWENAKKEGTEYPFLFVVLLQDKIDKDGAEIEKRILIEKKLSSNGKRKVMTYLTLDNSGMIIVLLCKTYNDGADLVDSFHRNGGQDSLKKMGVELSYSFTVAAIQKHFMESNNIERLNTHKLNRAYIYGIEKYPGSIKFVYNKLKDSLNDSLSKKESILGCNDEVIVIENINWSEFLKLYRDKTGILNHSSPEYTVSLLGLTTIITQKQDDTDSQAINQNITDNRRKRDTQRNKKPTLSQIMRTRIQQKEGAYFEIESSYLNRYLYQVINVLQKFDKPVIPDFIFCSMFLPINMVFDIAKNVTENVRKDFIRCFHEFVKGLNLCVQNSLRSDRQFTQSLAFDIQIYDTPVRLNAFYNAFIYYMKLFLQQLGTEAANGHRYEFLASVGVTDKIQVYELFKNISPENREFLVCIPEKQIYDLQLMLITLGHEVGHFVGQSIRNREYRYECAIQITVKMTSAYFLLKLKEKYAACEEDFPYENDRNYWEKFEKRLKKYLTDYFEQLKNPTFLKEMKFKNGNEEELQQICELYKTYQYYTHVLREMLVDGVNYVLCNKIEELFGYLQEMEYLNHLEETEDIARKKRETMGMRVLEISKELTDYSFWERKHLSIVTAVDRMIVLFKESEADLIDILTLKLSLKDYLWAIKKSISDQGKDQKTYPAEIIIRSGLVTCSMFYNEDEVERGYGWTDSELKEIANSNDDVLKNMAKDICNFKDKFFSENVKENSLPQVLYQTMDIFTTNMVLDQFLNYLLMCRERFASYLRNSNPKEDNELLKLQKKLQDMYNSCKEENIENLIWKIQEPIEQYKSHLQREIQMSLDDNSSYQGKAEKWGENKENTEEKERNKEGGKNKEKNSGDNALGTVFCEFLMGRLRNNFDKIPTDIMLCFSNIHPEEKNVICKGEKNVWPDSRIEATEKEYHAVWWIKGQENVCLKYFFEVIIIELEKRFSNLLFLEKIEEHLQDQDMPQATLNSFIAFFAEDLLNKEWVTAQYIKRILKGKNLPPLELLIQFSAQTYEKRTVNTRMYFPKELYTKPEPVLAFKNSDVESWQDRRLEGDNLRTVRKLMEMSGENQGLWINRNQKNGTYYVEGLISPAKASKLSVTEVHFTGHLSWQIIESDNLLFLCHEGKNQIPVIEQDKNRDQWKEDLAHITEELHLQSHCHKIEEIINVLKEQSHGTSIVFMQQDMLKLEVCRLTSLKRAYELPFNLLENKDKLLGISAIDGAMLADIDGMCYCIGTILDGEAVIEGDSGRGARYNSLLNYATWVLKKYSKEEVREEASEPPWCFVVVFSEDKIITIKKAEI